MQIIYIKKDRVQKKSNKGILILNKGDKVGWIFSWLTDAGRKNLCVHGPARDCNTEPLLSLGALLLQLHTSAGC